MPTPISVAITEEVRKDLPEDVVKRLDRLEGFGDLVLERYGYFLGRVALRSKMNDATKTERDAVTKLRKGITGDELETIITEGNITKYRETQSKITDARKAVNKIAKPHRLKIKPLTTALKVMDTIAIPDALKLLGKPLNAKAVRTSVSPYMQKKIEALKTKN